MSEPQREMTLDEYVGVLPDCHIAAKELKELRDKVKFLERENEVLCEDAAKRDLESQAESTEG